MRRNIKVMLVEDEAMSAIFLDSALRDMGYDVVSCHSTGEEAVARVQAEAPDVILMDVNLAGEINGLAAAEKIRERLAIPVVFITGYSESDIRKRMNGIPPSAIIVKPLNLKQLNSAIASAVDAVNLQGPAR